FLGLGRCPGEQLLGVQFPAGGDHLRGQGAALGGDDVRLDLGHRAQGREHLGRVDRGEHHGQHPARLAGLRARSTLLPGRALLVSRGCAVVPDLAVRFDRLAEFGGEGGLEGCFVELLGTGGTRFLRAVLLRAVLPRVLLLPGHSAPLVEGTPCTRASGCTAARRARASALNWASAMWCGSRPSSTRTCRQIPAWKAMASNTCRVMDPVKCPPMRWYSWPAGSPLCTR